MAAPHAPARVLTCRECRDGFEVDEAHRAEDFCPACVRRHWRHCDQCRQAYDRDGASELCPACRSTEPLFPLPVAIPSPRSGPA